MPSRCLYMSSKATSDTEVLSKPKAQPDEQVHGVMGINTSMLQNKNDVPTITRWGARLFQKRNSQMCYLCTSTRPRRHFSFFVLLIIIGRIELFFFLALLLSSLWTSRGRRCRPFSPRFLPSIFIAHRVQQSHCSSIFHRVLQTHALTRAFRKSICAQEKVPTSLYEYALGRIQTHETGLYQARG